MDRDIIMRKLDSLARCVERIEKKRPPTIESLPGDIDLQDIVSINLERAVQVSVDIGAHIIASLAVPPPKIMGEVFPILATEGVISDESSLALRKAVGFRNLSVHAYDQLNWEQVFEIIHGRLGIFRQYALAIARHLQK